MGQRASRRRFLKASAAVAAGTIFGACAGAPRRPTRARAAKARARPGDKLRLGVIGVGNRGQENLGEVAGEDVVALCDVDRGYLDAAAKGFPRARRYVDLREMIAEEDLDAVVVSTPDHTHAIATVLALESGLDVYCEKPLAHTVAEARRMTDLARATGAVTQMGIQIHARPNYHRVVEIVRSGAIGPVREVHVFCNGKTWSGGERPADTPRQPAGLEWDLWLGPAPERPYHPAYHPASWRRFWEFGGGTLADMACHYMDLPHWALELASPSAVDAQGPQVHADTTPPGLVVRWEHPARGDRAALALTWYDGARKPDVLAQLGLAEWTDGVLFVGDGGWLVADYDRYVLGPAERFAAFVPPAPSVPDSIGHHREWIEACKTRARTTCAFEYSGLLTEAVLLGNVAYRSGRRIEWDAARLAIPNAPEVEALLRRPSRRGWSV